MIDHTDSTGADELPSRDSSILGIVFIYATLAALWILLSDRIVVWLFSDPASVVLANTLKGWFFVLVTSILLFGLMRRMLGATTRSRRVPRPLRLPRAFSGVLAVVVIALTVAGVIYVYDRQESAELLQLQAIADLRSRQIADWVAERRGDATFSQSSPLWADYYRRWQMAGDRASRDAQIARFDLFMRTKGWQGVLLLGEQCLPIWNSEGVTPLSSTLCEASQQAVRDKEVRLLGPYRDPSGRVRLDILAPLTATGGQHGPVVVLRADPAVALFKKLEAWPVPSSSGETLIFRRDGDRVMFLNALRHQEDGAARLNLPISTDALLAARVLRGEAGLGELLHGKDYRGVPVLGVARSVPGTDWYLIAKRDRAEVYADAFHYASWIVVAGVLVLALLAAGAHLLWQRQQLAVAQRERLAEVQIRASEQRFRGLFESMQEGFFLLEVVVDAAGTAVDWLFIDVNPAHSKIIGLPRQAVVGKTLLSLFPDLEASWMNAYEQVWRSGQPIYREGAVDSKGRYYENYLYSSGPNQVACIFSDITERKAAELELKHLSDDMAATLQAIPDLLFEVDGQGRYSQVKAERTALLSAPASQLLGRTVAEMLPPEAAAIVFDALAAAESAGSDYGRVIGIPLADGDHWFELSVARKWGDLELAARFIVLARDVTERRQSELALQESERRFRQLFESAPVPLCYVGKDGLISALNARFQLTLGYTRDDLPSLARWGDLAYPDPDYRRWVIDTWHQAVDKAAATASDIEPLECQVRCKNGEIRTVIISGVTLGDDFLATCFDVTEKHRMDAELDSYRQHLEALVEARTLELAEARQRAETANAAKSAFLANMSHEIRTPMNAILGLTHLLGRSPLNEQQQQRLAKINTAATHLLAVLNDVLDISKIESGKLLLDAVDFSPAALFDQVRSMMQDKLQSKGLELVLLVDQLPPVLHGDQTRLRQALLNYLSNAVKFTEAGCITVRASIVEESGDTLLVRFEVEDHGIGIADDVQARLFDTFQQADASTTRKYGGTGLGLAITQRLASLMGGSSGLSSRLGEGSLFWFTARLGKRPGMRLPVPEAADHHAEEALEARHAADRLLLVEDSPINQEVALALLQEAGLSADVAANGEEAVRCVEAKHYDLILMDMQMPVMGGLDATRAIRCLPAGGSLPIIAMTANAFDENRAECLAAGMNDFIAKPVDPHTLFPLLLKWLPVRSGTPALPVAATALINEANGEMNGELWQGIAGLDAERCRQIFASKPERYSRLLQLFAEGHGGDVESIRQHLADHDQAAALMVSHTLKGIAANLGAERLQEVAGALNAAIDQGAATAEIEVRLIALAGELLPLIEQIRARPPVAEASIATVDQDFLHNLLAELVGLLDKGDVAACDLANRQEDLLRCGLGSAGEHLLDAIRRFDFAAALDLLKGLDAVS